MRYAIVTETYPPEINGVALTVQGLEEGLRQRGHEVTVVRPRQASDDEAPARHDTLLVRGAGLPRYPGLRFGMPAPLALREHFRHFTPDAIYVATEGPLGWSALHAARRMGIPAATGFHTRFDHYMSDYGMPWLQPVALRWMRRFHNGGDATLVPTHELAQWLEDQRFAKVQRLARAVDTSQFHPEFRDAELRAQWNAGEDTPVLLSVGRIAAEKNLSLAVNAFRTLQQRCPHARMVWVGDGPERAALQAANPDFIFCGMQRGQDLTRHYASADLFVFPSRSETFGNVTLEAMASGLATVAFDSGAAREHLRTGLHGAAVEHDDAFVEAVVDLGCNTLRRRAMGAAAHAAVQALQPAQVAADFDVLLSRLARQRKEHAHAVPA
ncbi:Glycosyltransferase involved in cell wall bisynthesis [Pseudoxanthomonas sp. GM95]|uniref:glycosyltransferase family 4 protein n=1 Tax=Pseudoxanthomonas sp. GM95 TaxID=1881043 RepID=UPI0008B3F16C|nr:glycosyltransferase family 1 protein [Pseudoxanthomonas sp. GM95]SEK71632.1 Glycosyltransferase involved in cell wall bisynthesis [Pseudoxanthomonas sp. GM95]